MIDLPSRYREPWDYEFAALVDRALTFGVVVLDMGAGASPTIPPQRRPPGCEYIGMDISEAELLRAPAGSYSRTLEANVSQPTALPGLQVDVIVSWQVLEHVGSMKTALANMHEWLAPGGQLIALFSGARAFFALAAKLMPHPARSRLLVRGTGVAAEDKFPTRYDACTRSQLHQLLEGQWSAYEVSPRYRGATYLASAPWLMRAYLRYENQAASRRWADLATHYVLHARK